MFWALTIRELFREFVVAKRMAEQRQDDMTATAWQTANFVRAKKLPPLRSVLNIASRRPQTAGQQRAALEMLSQQTGFPLRKAGDVTPIAPTRRPHGRR